MPLDVEEWGLDLVIGGSQKAFMIPPGLAFLSVSAKAWKMAERATLLAFNVEEFFSSSESIAAAASWATSRRVGIIAGKSPP